MSQTSEPPVVARVRTELAGKLAWAARAPAGEHTWARVREQAAVVLTALWRNGVLAGTSPEEAFFVRCDRTTMTQNDLDNGRLVVEVGLAVVQPAEFVIIRVGEFAPLRRPWWRRAT